MKDNQGRPSRSNRDDKSNNGVHKAGCVAGFDGEGLWELGQAWVWVWVWDRVGKEEGEDATNKDGEDDDLHFWFALARKELGCRHHHPFDLFAKEDCCIVKRRNEDIACN
ncbi:hypothetical protein PIB30_091192 [Stylosanthes scabra]|uniref:Uncharacterized protein n=1 Tax=Stylosanthes scabra TaxID=79078 RepID=A0ABU6UUL0_9FABA|nr:hypothetical protein [Stylosanthes scabra]